jgi:hypothetical protein
MTDAPLGWIMIGAATIWAGKGVSALLASRRAAATSSRRERAEKWQWLALGALQVIIGLGFITGPAILWWLTSGLGALLGAWMFVTDVSPWLRSRLGRSSNHASS